MASVAIKLKCSESILLCVTIRKNGLWVAITQVRCREKLGSVDFQHSDTTTANPKTVCHEAFQFGSDLPVFNLIHVKLSTDLLDRERYARQWFKDRYLEGARE